MSNLKQNYEKKLEDIQKFHEEDKNLLNNLLKKKDVKAKRNEQKSESFTEMENKYLKDIRDLNDSFDEYKKQV